MPLHRIFRISTLGRNRAEKLILADDSIIKRCVLEFINKYVAPWVLPGQAIPIHCVWVPEKDLRRIELCIPNDYSLLDTLNFEQYTYDKSTNAVAIPVDNLKSDNYLGIVITHPDIIDRIEKRDIVSLHFLDKESVVLDKLSLQTRVVRPKLEFLSYPKEIIVSDETNPKDLINLEILHSGFGTANLDMTVSHSGVEISKTDSVYFDVVRRVIEEIAHSLEGEKDVSMPEEFEVDEKMLRQTAQTLLKEASQEDLAYDISSDELREVKELLKDERKKEVVNRILLSNLRPLLMAALLYYSERHPEEDIKLLYGKITADLKERVDELSIKIAYYDSLWNVYPPIEAKIRVLDMRNFRGESHKFEAPVNIRWKRDVLSLGEGKEG
jgi:hypothetical protein